MLVGGTKMRYADGLCERSEWATENRKFTVSEKIINFLDMGPGFNFGPGTRRSLKLTLFTG